MTEAGGRIAETEVREAVPQEDSAGRFSGNRELLLRARAGDKAALEQLVIDNAGLVRSIAVRFRDRGTDMEDLMQIGTIGMIKAIRSFDTARGTAFSTYAVPLIVGEIRRHFRDDGLIRVSRSCRHLGVCLMRERSRILSEEGREAGIAELAAACGASVEDAAMALDALAPVSSLSDAAYGSSGNGDSPELGAVLPDEAATDELQRETDRIALAQVIAGLPPLWRQIVLLRYYRDMTQQQVADRLGLSQVKVSRAYTAPEGGCICGLPLSATEIWGRGRSLPYATAATARRWGFLPAVTPPQSGHAPGSRSIRRRISFRGKESWMYCCFAAAVRRICRRSPRRWRHTLRS